MPNINIENVDRGSVVLSEAEFDDETLTVGAAKTVKEGTVLARDAGTGDMVPYDGAGAGGAEIPKAVLPYEVTFDGAGSTPIRALVNGNVDRTRLWVDGAGSAGVTDAEADLLRDFGIVPLNVQDVSVLDNQ